ncbi:two-component sensor histidine kinase [Streptomyces paromomycinus]|uniref:histidine kinase n=1 Tax=Streptomyces paromomycinus TaxID=92743 RepID=A0A401W589_STREY|nr:two-component sensor histidine kinase [Streptomyces paromomycinus]
MADGAADRVTADRATPDRAAVRAAGVRLAEVRAAIGRGWRCLARPEQWPPYRVVGESLLALLLGLIALGMEKLSDSGDVRTWLVTGAVVVLAPLRRALPGTVLIIAAALSWSYAGMMVLLIVAGWSAGRRIAGSARALAVFAVALLAGTVVPVVQDFPLVSPEKLMILAVCFLAIVAMPGISSRYWSQNRTLVETLHAQRTQLLRENAMIARQTRLRERQRIAQDMHDSLGHQLTLIAVHTGALEVDSELNGRQREAVGVLRGASVAAMRELREVVGLLRDEHEDTAGAHPAIGAGTAPDAGQRGVDQVDALAEASRGAGARISVSRSGEPRALAPAVDRAAYRIVQEGLTNAHKHASGAPVAVALRYEPDSLLVEVVNGPVPPGAAGGPQVSGGQGLTGLRERARLVGGMVHSGPVPGGGFRLAGVLPYGPVAVPATAREPVPTGEAAGAAAGPGGPGGPCGPDAPIGGFPDPGRGRPVVRTGKDGKPVIDWSRVYAAPDTAMFRGEPRRSGFAVGCGLAAGVVVVLGLVTAWGAVELFKAMEESSVAPATFERLKTGAPEDEVREQLPAESFLNSELNDQGPAKPEGARCETFASDEPSEDWAQERAFRFCFKDGKLVEKQTFVGKV